MLCTSDLAAQTYWQYINKGKEAQASKKMKLAAKYLDKACRKGKDNYYPYFRAAQAWALANNTTKACKRLYRAIDLGGLDVERIVKSDAFSAILYTKSWQTLIEYATALESGVDSLLRDKLAQIYENDQMFRSQMKDTADRYGWESPQFQLLTKKQREIDSIQFPQVVSLIQTHGYPTRKQVGDQSGTPFLVIQHYATHEKLEKLLPILKRAARKGDLRYSRFAMLEDNFLIKSGKKQKYATQLKRDSETNTFMFFKTRGNFDRVNKRRAKVGLMHLRNYARRFNATFE